MRNLYIIGARGSGRETYNLYLNIKDTLPDVKCAGFLDDKKDALKDFEDYPPIVSTVEEFIPSEEDVFICALGEPKWVNHYSSIIESKGGNFISLISPLASIGRNTIIGKGCIIPRWTVISPDVKIGDHTSIGVFTNIGHDVNIGDYCHLGAYTFIGGRSKIGSLVTIHPRANILPDKKIGDNAIVGAGSIVIKNIKEGETVFGVPARKIK